MDRLLEFFPPQHRTAEAFNKHFTVGAARSVLGADGGHIARVVEGSAQSDRQRARW